MCYLGGRGSFFLLAWVAPLASRWLVAGAAQARLRALPRPSSRQSPFRPSPPRLPLSSKQRQEHEPEGQLSLRNARARLAPAQELERSRPRPADRPACSPRPPAHPAATTKHRTESRRSPKPSPPRSRPRSTDAATETEEQPQQPTPAQTPCTRTRRPKAALGPGALARCADGSSAPVTGTSVSLSRAALRQRPLGIRF